MTGLPCSPVLSLSPHSRCLPGSTVWVVMTACLPNESIFLLLMLCIYTHCNLPYKPQRRERESERERASESQRECERQAGRERGRERRTDKALLPDSRQPSFPSPAKYNSANAATGSIPPGWGSREKVDGCWAGSLANKQFFVPAGSTFLIYVTGCWNALFQTVHVIIIIFFFFFWCILAWSAETYQPFCSVTL